MKQSAEADFVMVAAVDEDSQNNRATVLPGDRGRGNRYEACLRRLSWAMRQSAKADFVVVAAVSTARNRARHSP
jgi:hypothetical protein